MKLHSLKIQNFRAIKDLDLDFTDTLSRPKQINLIVGPNGSGKTSILDAIQIVVRTLEEPYKPRLRKGLKWSATQLVRGRGNQTQIEFEYSIEEEEANAINELYQALGRPLPFPSSPEGLLPLPPFKESAIVKWQYPRLQDSSKGWRPYRVSIFPKKSAKVLGARGTLDKAIANNYPVQYNLFNRIGGVCYLDQRRSLRLAKSRSTTIIPDQDDVLSWLTYYCYRHLIWNVEKYGPSYWSRVQGLFNQVCYPAQLVGLESGPTMDTLTLKRNLEYDLLQMSSGEHQVLRVLVGLVSETAINSIVLIDEAELHLHPNWQSKLFHALLGEKLNNQYIITTHSPQVRQFFSTDEVIKLDNSGGPL
jgi:predicted ATPase